MQRLVIILLMLFVGQLVFDNASPAVAAQPNQIAPSWGILPPGYTCTMTVYDMKDGKPYEVPARVAAYVIWIDRPLTLEYYVSDDLNGFRNWSVMSRDLLSKVCK